MGCFNFASKNRALMLRDRIFKQGEGREVLLLFQTSRGRIIKLRQEKELLLLPTFPDV